MKAEEKIKTGFGGRMAKELDEDKLMEYCEEWGINIDSDKFRNEILPLFENREPIGFGKFWKQFERNVIEEKWLEIKVWWKYVYEDGKYILSEKVNTLFTK